MSVCRHKPALRHFLPEKMSKPFSFVTCQSCKLNMKNTTFSNVKSPLEMQISKYNDPYIDHPVAVAPSQIVQHRCLVQMGQHSHVLYHVKFGRVHWLHVIFFYTQGLQRQISTATLESTGFSVASHILSYRRMELFFPCRGKLFSWNPAYVRNTVCFHSCQKNGQRPRL